MKIGKTMRVLRKQKSMTLEELSQKSGVALATLSRMENDKMPGTVASHNKICKVLGVSIADLYRELEDESKIVESVTKGQRTEHFVHARGATYELLVMKAMEKKLMPLMMRISGGGITQEEKNKPGVEKFVYVITGAIEATVGDQTYTLKRGDSLYLDASLTHTFANTGKPEAEAVCIVSPPAL